MLIRRQGISGSADFIAVQDIRHSTGRPCRHHLIGGTAASLAMAEAGLEFRATKDLEIVLHLEALSSSCSSSSAGPPRGSGSPKNASRSGHHGGLTD